MSHSEYDDADDPRPLAPKRSRKGVVAIAAVVGLVAVLAAAVAVGAVRSFRDRAGEDAARAEAAKRAALGGDARARRTWTHPAFRGATVGRTANEVRMLVGAPAAEGLEDGLQAWHYPGRTTDPATGNVDADAVIIFKDGLAAEVRFDPPAGAAKN